MSILDRLRPPTGLRVLVTAGAGGIGRTIAEAFAEAGGRVFVCDIDAAALDGLPPGIGRCRTDMARPDAVAAMVAEAEAFLGGFDVVVNNAGIAGPTAAVAEITPEDWQRTLDINLGGQFLVARHTAPALIASQGGMINLASVAGRLPFAHRSPYAASKWGVVGLTKSLAAELGPEGVRVNAILPGIVRGPRIDAVIAARAARHGISAAEEEARTLANVSLRRMVEAEDMAALALFLCAPGGRNITGQALSVCGQVERL